MGSFRGSFGEDRGEGGVFSKVGWGEEIQGSSSKIVFEYFLCVGIVLNVLRILVRVIFKYFMKELYLIYEEFEVQRGKVIGIR